MAANDRPRRPGPILPPLPGSRVEAPWQTPRDALVAAHWDALGMASRTGVDRTELLALLLERAMLRPNGLSRAEQDRLFGHLDRITAAAIAVLRKDVWADLKKAAPPEGQPATPGPPDPEQRAALTSASEVLAEAITEEYPEYRFLVLLFAGDEPGETAIATDCPPALVARALRRAIGVFDKLARDRAAPVAPE